MSALSDMLPVSSGSCDIVRIVISTSHSLTKLQCYLLLEQIVKLCRRDSRWDSGELAPRVAVVVVYVEVSALRPLSCLERAVKELVLVVDELQRAVPPWDTLEDSGALLVKYAG